MKTFYIFTYRSSLGGLVPRQWPEKDEKDEKYVVDEIPF